MSAAPTGKAWLPAVNLRPSPSLLNALGKPAKTAVAGKATKPEQAKGFLLCRCRPSPEGLSGRKAKWDDIAESPRADRTCAFLANQ